MLKLFRFISSCAFLASLAWAIYKPGWDSICAAIAALAAVLAAFITGSSKSGQVQSIKGSGIGIQAGGDVKIGGK